MGRDERASRNPPSPPFRSVKGYYKGRSSSRGENPVGGDEFHQKFHELRGQVLVL